MRKSQLPLSLCSFGSSDVPMPNARASAVPELPMPNARASAGPEIPICYSGTLQTCTGLQLRYLASPSLSSLHNHTIPDTFKSYYPACSPTITRTAASSPEATPPLPAEPESKPKIRLDYEQQQRAGKVRKTGNARTYRALFATNIPDHTKHEEPEKPPVDPPLISRLPQLNGKKSIRSPKLTNGDPERYLIRVNLQIGHKQPFKFAPFAYVSDLDQC